MYQRLDVHAKDAKEYVKYVPIKQIFPPDFDIRTRREKEKEYVNELKRDIRENGLIHPVILRHHSDITYEVIAGLFRVGACADLGYEEIPARILDVDDVTALTIALRENKHRKDITTFEEARVISRLRHVYDMKWQTISDITGLTKRWCRKLHRVKQECPEPLYTKWKKNQVSFTTAYNALVNNEGKDPHPKFDFLTGKRLNDYETVRLDPDTVGDLSAIKNDAENINHVLTQHELKQIFFDGDNPLINIFRERFKDYGVDIANALFNILNKYMKYNH